jgi:hypothetical protein
MVGIITAKSSSEGNEEYEVIPLALAAANTLSLAYRPSSIQDRRK